METSIVLVVLDDDVEVDEEVEELLEDDVELEVVLLVLVDVDVLVVTHLKPQLTVESDRIVKPFPGAAARKSHRLDPLPQTISPLLGGEWLTVSLWARVWRRWKMVEVVVIEVDVEVEEEEELDVDEDDEVEVDEEVEATEVVGPVPAVDELEDDDVEVDDEVEELVLDDVEVEVDVVLDDEVEVDEDVVTEVVVVRQKKPRTAS